MTSLMLTAVAKRLKERGIELITGDDVSAYFAKRGFDPAYGARPLRREIQQRLEDSLSEEILSGKIKIGDKVIVKVKDGMLSFEKSE